jgi:hypothetical protein
VLLGVIAGGIRIAAAMSGSDKNTDMTKSVARITWKGVYKGKQTSAICTGSVVGDHIM